MSRQSCQSVHFIQLFLLVEKIGAVDIVDTVGAFFPPGWYLDIDFISKFTVSHYPSCAGDFGAHFYGRHITATTCFSKPRRLLTFAGLSPQVHSYRHHCYLHAVATWQG